MSALKASRASFGHAACFLRALDRLLAKSSNLRQLSRTVGQARAVDAREGRSGASVTGTECALLKYPRCFEAHGRTDLAKLPCRTASLVSTVSLLNFVLGRRLANREAEQRKIGAFEGVPAMGLDGLGSSAYGPEAALSILMPLGAASTAWIGWVMVPIIVLLGILFISYWQTIRAYPVNGGAYTVARENLGTTASLVAAAALMIDYVLNVAVGISAGVGALISAVPTLHAHQLALCLGILVLTTLLNLRGTLESGRALALPTYTFIASFFGILAIGAYRTIASGGHPQAVIAPPVPPPGTEAITLWLLLRAIASGCTAMTGVESVSNGVNAFREPPVKHAHRTLAAIVCVLGLLLAGIAYLASAYSINAMDQTQEGYQSVWPQLGAAVVGRGVYYHVAIASLLCILALSANTSFVGFPRLCRAVAEDRYLPKSFTIAGRRLVFTVSIVFLGCTAGLLLIGFDGITDRLIPLFAIGAFMSFTLSQVSMVVHWWHALHKREPGTNRQRIVHSLWINALGAFATAVALLIITATKFAEGAWITLLAVPCTLLLLRSIRRYYDRIERETGKPRAVDTKNLEAPVVLIPIDDVDRLAIRSVQFALSISHDVIGLHLTQLHGPQSEEHELNLHVRWRAFVEEPARAAGIASPRLMVVPGQRRLLHQPVLRLVEKVSAELPGRKIAVLIPEIIPPHWYQQFLHTHRGLRLRLRLLQHGNARLTVMVVPWHLSD
jgi:amino acid transporter